jgi:pentatricopeptide repeat protein
MFSSSSSRLSCPAAVAQPAEPNRPPPTGKRQGPHGAGKENTQHHRSSSTSSAQAAPADPTKTSVPDDAPSPFDKYLKAFTEGKSAELGQLKNLFAFYIDALGYEDGIKSLRVVLDKSPLVTGFAAPRSRKNTRCLNDNMVIPGVERLVSLLEDERPSNQEIFRAYRDIPSPGVSHLSEASRGRLLRRLANPPRPRRVHGVRFLAIIDDMCKADLYIAPAFWTTAIHLAGKCTPQIRDGDLILALDVWHRMEAEGKTPSTSADFNVLFDIAIKAGEWKFADKIVNEMKKRGLGFSRFGRVAQIYWRGLQGDELAVREAYREFVQQGEVVDTVVLNCVMVSLIRCGRYDLAEQMYERMADVRTAISRKGHGIRLSTLYPQPFDNYSAYRRASKRLGRALGMAAFLREKLPEQHRALQSALPLTPDAKTFHILLSYHALESGDLEGFLRILRHMECHFSMPPQGMVYLLLFQAFAKHASMPKSPWTLKRLQGAWRAFLRAVDNSKYQTSQDPHTKKRLAKLIWENPLTGIKKTVITPDVPESTSEPRMPSLRRRHESEEVAEDEKPSLHIPNPFQIDGEESDYDDVWSSENRVFLGRKVIVTVLHAFSECGGPDAVLEVWDEIERLWRPNTQKLADVVAVRKALRRLAG